MSKRTCVASECSNKVLARSLCRKHYLQERYAHLDCLIDGCEKPVVESGYCKPHSHQARRGTLGRREALLRDRFFSRVAKRADGCWEWTGLINSRGYGQLTFSGFKTRLAHHVSWEIHNGTPVPATVDHICHEPDSDCPSNATCLHRRCVNPDHLRALSTRDNVRRGNGPAGINARKTHCIRGHEFDSLNTKFDRNGNRSCRACDRLRKRRK